MDLCWKILEHASTCVRVSGEMGSEVEFNPEGVVELGQTV